MKIKGYIERCNLFFMRKRLQKRFEKTAISELPFPASNTLLFLPIRKSLHDKHLRTLPIPNRVRRGLYTAPINKAVLLR